ncbi:MAG: DUF4435 domain-containing protein [Methanomassiliicoccaceae archaeon]|nr:DUF4435 domain-containing protein [Methanomassiliicoccaceae archaeon]
MIESLTSADIANTVSMMRSLHKGPILVVEGVTDSRLFGKFVDRDGVRIVTAHSKENVRRSVGEAWGARGDKRVLGILDADLDRLCGKRHNPPVFVTDKRDMETMIMSTPALDDVLAEYADPGLLAAFEERHGKVGDAVARASYPIGLLMLVSSRERLGLCFKNMDYQSFINKRTLAIDVRGMIGDVFSQSSVIGAGKREIADKIAEEEEVLDDPWAAARGHDAVSVLALGLSETFGAYNGKDMKYGQASGALRLAFSLAYFKETELYKDTLKWSEKHNYALWVTR